MGIVDKAVLVLNASYEPVSISSARNALKLLAKERIAVEEDYGRDVYPGIPLPSVVRLKEYRKIPIRISILTRKNIYARDHYVCQYCGKKCMGKDLTLDHILPESRGGPFAWDNLVTCCRDCNRKKDDRTPEEAGMTLLKVPRRLNVHTSRYLLRLVGLEEDKAWEKYLYA